MEENYNAVKEFEQQAYELINQRKYAELKKLLNNKLKGNKDIVFLMEIAGFLLI